MNLIDIIYLLKVVEIMKSNIFILHSLNGDTLEMWGKQVSAVFEKQTEVIMPKFPIRAESSYLKFDEILSEYFENGRLNQDSVVVCHSIGNAYFIRFCAKYGFAPKAYIAVAPGAVYHYPSSRNDYIVEVLRMPVGDTFYLPYENNENKFEVLKITKIKD